MHHQVASAGPVHNEMHGLTDQTGRLQSAALLEMAFEHQYRVLMTREILSLIEL